MKDNKSRTDVLGNFRKSNISVGSDQKVAEIDTKAEQEGEEDLFQVEKKDMEDSPTDFQITELTIEEKGNQW